MNYITEINAFYQRLETNRLSINAVSLWHTLMQINNRTGWKKVFSVAVSTLCDKAVLSDSTFKRARIELRDKGYIHYESRGGNLAAMYQIITAEEYALNEKTELILSSSVNLKSECSSKVAPNLDDKPVPLVKQDETKQITTTTTEAVIFFEDNIGKVSPFILKELNQLIEEVGEELVIEAMKRSVERGKVNWGYIKAILKSWSEKGFKAVEDVKQEAVLFSVKDNQTKQKKETEVIPEWFKNPNKVAAPAVDESVNQELARLMAAYASG